MADATVHQLPVVDHIQGCTTEPRATARETVVAVQYTDRAGKWYELQMPFLDAMFLRNMLNEVERAAALGRIDNR